MRSLLAAGALVLLPGLGLAHGPWAWIQQVAPKCCGEADCFKVSAAAGPQGYVFAHAGRSFFIPYAAARPSLDGDFWACLLPDGDLRNVDSRPCFFAPVSGS